MSYGGYIVIFCDAEMIKEKPESISDEEYQTQMEGFISDMVNRNSAPKYKHPAFYGYFSFLKQLHKKNFQFDKNICYIEAARGGHINIMQWVESEFGEIKEAHGDDAISSAAINGQLEVVELLSSKFTIRVSTYSMIVSNSRINIITWMLSQDKYKDIFDNESVLAATFRDSSLSVLTYYIEEYLPKTKGEKKVKQIFIDYAARDKQMSILKYLSSKEIYPSKQALDQIFSLKGNDFIKGEFGKWYVMNDIEEKAVLVPDYNIKIVF